MRPSNVCSRLNEEAMVSSTAFFVALRQFLQDGLTPLAHVRRQRA